MPIYEYRCEQGHTFEVMQRMSDEPVVSCQTCEAPVERVFHPVAVHFKGSGFYTTDYGSRRRQHEGGDSGNGGKEKASSETKSEAKSESSAPKSDSKSGPAD